MNGIPPFLDNIGTVGAAKRAKATEPPHVIERTRNRRRGYMHSQGAAVNKRVAWKLQDWFHSEAARNMSEDSLQHFCTLRSRLTQCCKNSLYRNFHEGNDLQFIASHTCDHKYCFVCNKLRSKTIRRKFVRFFQAYPEVRENYDFMHLTLTVPHTTGGWRGKTFYATELMKQFNLMRKKDFWKEQVYAGEFGVEITKNQNGLHIHIHSLVLVYKGRGNRNRLHRDILMHWNKNTATGKHVAIKDEKVIRDIKAGNKTLTDEDVGQLTATGSTIMGLESLYVTSETERPGYKYKERIGRYIRYVDGKDDADFMAGLLECIKYHFEPSGMYLDEGELDFDLLNEILPNIYKKPLYRKFGAFHTRTKIAHPGAAMLNFNEEKDPIEDVLAETANETVTNPANGEPVEREEYSYFVTRADKVFWDKENEYAPRIGKHTKRVYLHNAHTMLDALLHMLTMSNPYINKKQINHAQT